MTRHMTGVLTVDSVTGLVVAHPYEFAEADLPHVAMRIRRRAATLATEEGPDNSWAAVGRAIDKTEEHTEVWIPCRYPPRPHREPLASRRVGPVRLRLTASMANRTCHDNRALHRYLILGDYCHVSQWDREAFPRPSRLDSGPLAYYPRCEA